VVAVLKAPSTRSAATLSAADARRLVLAAQGLSVPRASGDGEAPGRTQLRRVMRQLGAIQLDAVNVLARTQFLVPFSRIGAYDPAVFRGLSGPGQPWFEQWGHAASLMPVELYPLSRWRMEKWSQDLVDSPAYQERRRQWRAAHSGYLQSVLAEVRDRGPLAASQLSEPRRQSGQWWDRRSTGRRALELLLGDGVLAAWRSTNFERIYDLAERVIPAKFYQAPPPGEEAAKRELLVLGARSLGVGTAADLADYFWLRLATARRLIGELVEEGRLVEVSVEGWNEAAYAPGNFRLSQLKDVKRQEATLISPFDSLIWTRQRTHRLFGFHYRVEIYVPGHLRAHGYYVTPLLLGDELVARLDLKADRNARALLVAGAFAEDEGAGATTAEATLAELQRVRDWLGLERVVIEGRGDFVPLLRAAAGGGKRRARKNVPAGKGNQPKRNNDRRKEQS